ncbi:restriction endonuclease subunit S [Aliarcobacter butzleri]|uniref:restriction endonuclease subunit S n=1 Tax=Aliarcobacter butzleri TaxID=28197 RepID=UPI00125F9756|nr:restriction endonuclease subunit S [Aliarcobacter butzleri]
MKYKKYPSYKDSGVEWLGEIPSEWINTKLKYHSFIYNGNSISDNEKENYENLNTNFSIPYISTKDIDSNFLSIDYDNGMRISVNNDKFRRAKKGSSLICIEGGSAGKKLGLLEKDVCFVNKLACIDSYNNLDNKFCNYILRSSVFNYLFSLSTTGLIPGVSINQLKDFEINLPPLNEQQQIANYLDEKTSKIDTLIKKQTKQIGLLKEKRQAVISHAVTKGINPNVSMKNSGVEWLGQIPEHWIVSKFGFIKTVLTDYTANGSFADLAKNVKYKNEESYARLVRLTDLRTNLENTDGVWIDESAYNYLKKSSLYGGEFLLANVGAYAGLFYQMPYINKPASLAPNMFMAKFNNTKVSEHFMSYVAKSESAYSQLKLKATASSAQPKLNKDDFKSIVFAYPCLLEQQQIANYLDDKISKIDILIEKSNKSIELLKEKRTAIISAAVTGKIDVREKV